MGQSKVRLAVQALEARETPAASLWANALQTQAIASFFQSTQKDLGWLANPATRTAVQQLFTGIFQYSENVIDQAGGASGVGALAQMNAGFAQMVGASLNFDVDAPPAPPTPPAPPPDGGMTNTIPDINASNWVTRASGLKTWDVRIGTGDPVAAGDSITVFYTGWLLNGTVFDSKRSPATPATFALSGLIQGWQEGIVGMRPGGIRRLYVPSALGYGTAGQGNIPPNADLVFEIKVVSHT